MDAPESPRSPLLASPAARLSRARQILDEAQHALATTAEPTVPSVPGDASQHPVAPTASEPPAGDDGTPAPTAATAGASTRLALSILSGAVRPFAAPPARRPER